MYSSIWLKKKKLSNAICLEQGVTVSIITTAMFAESMQGYEAFLM